MEPGGPLQWGWHYAMVRPTYFRIEYGINPFMDLADQPDPDRSERQWRELLTTLRSLGARVDVLEPVADAPDMVYAMNLGLGVRDPQRGRRMIMSHMRYAERRGETEPAAAAFRDRGYATSTTGKDGIGGHFESGDAFPYAATLLVGYGKRSDEVGLKTLAGDLGVDVLGLRIVHPAMYHLDLAFCPLTDRAALICPDAFDDASARAVRAHVPEPIELSVEEALTFCANSVVVGETVVMPACPARVRQAIEAVGLDVVVVGTDEFHKGGGSIRCLTNPLDIELGRDLDAVPGGRLRMAR